MAEALGVASAVAGIISLGITACHGMISYYESVKGHRDDINNMCSSIGSLAAILKVIQQRLLLGQFDRETVAVVEQNIVQCEQSLTSLDRKVQKICICDPNGTVKSRLLGTKNKALYPFKESTVAKLREVCDDLKDNLCLSINALHIDAAVTAQQRLDVIADISMTTSKTVLDTAELVRKLAMEQDTAASSAIHSWLTPLTRAFQNRHRESLSTKGRQHKGAQELFESPEFKGWVSSAGTTLWCRGPPGIGKTVNVSYLIEALQEQSKGQNIGVVYLYFSYKDTASQTPVNIMASILQHLVLQHPFSKVFIIIDALDELSEVEEVRSIVLTELKRLQHYTYLLIMSRPIIQLDVLLEDSVRISVEASPKDIENYLQERLGSTRSMQKHLSEEAGLQGIIIARIMHKIKGMFLMARLYLDTVINKMTRRKIKSALETLPEGLDSIYEELISRIRLQNPTDHAELALRVLAWVFHAARPLAVVELQHALATEQGDGDLDEDGIPSRDLLVTACAGMVVIDDNSDTIGLVHYTTQEYFQHSGKRLLENSHHDIAATCLTYMRFKTISEAVHDLVDQQELLQQLLQRFPLLRYAAQHWGEHLRESGDNSISSDDAIELLTDNAMVNVLVWIKDYMESSARGVYFKQRTQVTGLSLAASFGLGGVVSSLIEEGLLVNNKDSNGQTALHWIAETEFTDTAAVLLKSGAEVGSKDLQGRTPLHRASTRSQNGIAKLLIQHGALVNDVDGYNATALYRAAETGSEKVVRFLLGKNADVSIGNSYHQTALHRAADAGHLEVVNLLLRGGADAKVKDYYGYTPLYRALDQGHEQVAKLLRGYMMMS
ncbi:hypothetical protein QQS21_003618 [Conoideocrella luteorostrata]|uniref:NACHT domain-containing protein n=1 Tax=Conoideocrella luteorostrata TaxID=1105319 RepID=A0AAJ0CSZ2_9HYPO|nr:hypothetical protein QQS21_003618 [Conoideocrella luteorostrata]